MKEYLNHFKKNIDVFNFLTLINIIKDIKINKIYLNYNID